MAYLYNHVLMKCVSSVLQLCNRLNTHSVLSEISYSFREKGISQEIETSMWHTFQIGHWIPPVVCHCMTLTREMYSKWLSE